MGSVSPVQDAPPPVTEKEVGFSQAEAVTVMVEPFLNRTVVPDAPVPAGIRYSTIDLPAATVTLPANVFEDVLVWPALPNVVTGPPLLLY